MKTPGRWKEQWCQTTVPERKTGAGAESGTDNRIPLIKLEAMFAPPSSDSSRDPNYGLESKQHEEATHPKEKEDEHSLPTHNPLSAEALDATIIRPGKTSEFQGSSDPSEPHLLRVVSFWIPAACGVCSSVMFGRNTGFRCEECSILCCSDCRLHVDLRIPCGSEAARLVAAKSIQKKISFSNLLSIVAPDEAYTQSRHTDIQSDRNDKLLPTSTPSMETGDVRAGVGCLKLEFIRACLFERHLPAESDPTIIFGGGAPHPVRQGDYYARISIAGSTKTARTRTLQNTGMPKFGSVEMRFNV
jgi:hypothetical protein